MQRMICLIIGLTALAAHSNGQTPANKNIYNSMFKWTIAIPDSFVNVSAAEWDRLQNKGRSAIEKTYGQKVVNETKTIFAFKNGKSNYLESNYEVFDSTGKDSYLETCLAADNIVYETFKAQMPDVTMDTSRTVETVAGLEFQKFAVSVTYMNKVLLHLLMYSRLFGNKDLTVSMVYTDDKMGKNMLASWMNSKFGK